MGENLELIDNPVREEPNEQKSVEVPFMRYFFINLIVFTLPIYLLVLFGILCDKLIYWIHLNTLFGLTPVNFLSIHDFWIYIFLPLIIIGAVFIYILCVIGITWLFSFYFNKKSPPVEGLFRREFNGKDVSDPRIRYYHYRGFIIKYPLWLAYKSPFQWMSYWVLKIIGHNKISKDALYLEAFPGLEFINLEKGVVFYPGSAPSSHVVDSLYGNLSIERLNFKNQVTILPNCALAPGGNFDANYVLMPNSMSPKRWRGNNSSKHYSGAPARAMKGYSGIFSRMKPDAQILFKEKGYLLGDDIDKLKN